MWEFSWFIRCSCKKKFSFYVISLDILVLPLYVAVMGFEAWSCVLVKCIWEIPDEDAYSCPPVVDP